MTRLLAAVALLAALAGCGVPAAVAWSTIGAGLGWAASVNSLGTELLRRQPSAEEHPAIEEMPTPP